MNNDGSGKENLTMSAGYLPRFSPDGNWIIYDSQNYFEEDGPDILTIRTDGTKMTRLSTPHWLPKHSADKPVLSPDGEKVAYISTKGYECIPRIFTINADGTGEICLELPDRLSGIPIFSPDGLKIVFINEGSNLIGRKLYTVNTNGSGLKMISDNEIKDLPVFSPDGSKMAFLGEGGDGAIFNLYIGSIESGGFKKVSDLDVQGPPVFSPDSKDIVYTALNDEGFDLYKSNTNTLRGIRLTNIPGVIEFQPAYSPDGAKIVFVAGLSTEYGDICVMNPDGSGVKRLTHYGGNKQPLFSADGKSILYYHYRERWSVDINGTNNMRWIRSVDQNTGEISAPRPENRIVYTESIKNPHQTGNTEYVSEVFIMNPDGTDIRQLTYPPWGEW